MMYNGTDVPRWRVLEHEMRVITSRILWTLPRAQDYATYAAEETRLTRALVKVPTVTLCAKHGVLGHTQYGRGIFALNPKRGTNWGVTMHEMAHWVLRCRHGHTKRFALELVRMYGLFCRWAFLKGIA